MQELLLGKSIKNVQMKPSVDKRITEIEQRVKKLETQAEDE